MPPPASRTPTRQGKETHVPEQTQADTGQVPPSNPQPSLSPAEPKPSTSTQVFGATERMRTPGPEGTIAHAEIEIADSVIIVEDASPYWAPRRHRQMASRARRRSSSSTSRTSTPGLVRLWL
jgi:hypothetical protein